MMVTEPQVTAIMPVRNGAAYLAASIESVLLQQTPVRLIVVDDGSTDATPDILLGLGERIFTVRQNQGGQAAALNSGLALADTPWIAFNDADDLWEPDKLARQFAAAAEHPEAALIFGHCLEFASGEALVHPDRWPIRTAPTPGYGAGGVLIRADLLRQMKGFDQKLTYGAFVDLFARAAHLGAQSVMLDAVVFRRRIHGGNMSIKMQHARQDYLAIARGALSRRRSG